MKCFQKVFRNVDSWATNTWTYNPDTHSLTSGWLLFFLHVQSKCSEAARTLRDKNTDVTSVCSYVIYWCNLISWLDVCCNEKTCRWLIQIFVLFSSFISDSSKSITTAKYDKFTQYCLCWLTVCKRMSRSESSCLSEGWDTCTLDDKTLKALSKPSARRRERNSAESKDKLAPRERANKSCSDRKNSRNS